MRKRGLSLLLDTSNLLKLFGSTVVENNVEIKKFVRGLPEAGSCKAPVLHLSLSLCPVIALQKFSRNLDGRAVVFRDA